LARCSAIRKDGAPCRAVAIRGRPWCPAHDPEFTRVRQQGARKGGRTGGRGRSSKSSAELRRLQERFEEIAARVESGALDRGRAAVMIQALGGARACVRDSVAAREQEEIDVRLAELEDELEARKDEEWRGVR
jgi:hypothetical protein